MASGSRLIAEIVADLRSDVAAALTKGGCDRLAILMAAVDRAQGALYEAVPAHVALMSVPRCDGCTFWVSGKRQFWKTTDGSQEPMPAFGECTAARAPKVLLRTDGNVPARMITRDEFGCVQWKGKD